MKNISRRKFLKLSAMVSAGCIIGCGGSSNESPQNPNPVDSPIPKKKSVIFQMDDIQAWWLEDVAARLVDIHINEGVPVTLGVIPIDLHYREGEPGSITENLKKWHKYNSDVVEIATHTYNHEDYSTWTLTQQIEDIKKGKKALNDLGLETKTFVPAYNWGNEFTAQAIVDAGMKIGMDGQENPYVDSTSNPMILEDGFWYDEIKNDQDNFNDWNFANLEKRLDERIDKRGYGLISYHMQDFETATDADYDKFTDFLLDLEGSGKYSCMTAGQYFKHVNE